MPLSYQDVARMIWACRDAPAIPFIRVPDASEGAIQKATDIGALGIIVPMVFDAEKMEQAVKFAKFPPVGRRSQGGGQYGALWGRDYCATFNDNVVIVAMIEAPVGPAVAAEIASVPGVDVIFAASSDIRSFSGHNQGEPEYEEIITYLREETLGAGRKLGGRFTEIGYKKTINPLIDDHTPYESSSDSGQKLKSVTIPIRDKKNKTIGSFSVNMNIDYFESLRGFINQIIDFLICMHTS